MNSKQRLSASVDAELVAVGQRAVASGRAANLSAWVNEALKLKCEHDRRLAALAELIADFESEHGEISATEITAATRRARARSRPARGLGPQESKPARG
jgi:Arc/MetJ-type ribon-helix-helix transcriptional regulator